ncbi:hypothetical protein [Herbaspirillum sp. NPDC101397]|uniref:hypothetical protein n=1 Tax=Herbaspirillum sp. NPDC101397 TaxID=3364006 RepID=UPI00383A9A74
MKNTQMIVDNLHHTVAAAMAPAMCCGTINAERFLWCTPRAAASLLVRNFTKLLQIIFSIVDNADRRYDSCMIANKLSLPSNP